jgi:hypothetical protein
LKLGQKEELGGEEETQRCYISVRVSGVWEQLRWSVTGSLLLFCETCTLYMQGFTHICEEEDHGHGELAERSCRRQQVEFLNLRGPMSFFSFSWICL